MNKSSFLEAAKEAAQQLINRFGGRAEVKTYGTCADVFFEPRTRCNYSDIITEAEQCADRHGIDFNHAYIGGYAVCQFFA